MRDCPARVGLIAGTSSWVSHLTNIREAENLEDWPPKWALVMILKGRIASPRKGWVQTF